MKFKKIALLGIILSSLTGNMVTAGIHSNGDFSWFVNDTDDGMYKRVAVIKYKGHKQCDELCAGPPSVPHTMNLGRAVVNGHKEKNTLVLALALGGLEEGAHYTIHLYGSCDGSHMTAATNLGTVTIVNTPYDDAPTVTKLPHESAFSVDNF